MLRSDVVGVTARMTRGWRFLHAAQACRCALEQRRTLATLRNSMSIPYDYGCSFE
jgi:hypothetical protein